MKEKHKRWLAQKSLSDTTGTTPVQTTERAQEVVDPVDDPGVGLLAFSADHAASTNLAADPEGSFPIVGIGASAGGFSAFKTLLQHLPDDTGMAFILIQHLDPNYQSILPDLLEKQTKLPVVAAQDNQQVRPNRVYVIPPNHGLGIYHRTLQWLPRDIEQPHTIDTFFKLLATDLNHLGIGVLLSGMGSDGTSGLQEINAKGGVTFAQNEATAECFAMPGNAIAAGVVDYVLSPREIAMELVQIARRPGSLRRPDRDVRVADDPGEHLAKIFMLLRAKSGNDFSCYKQNMVLRRIKRRMAVNRLERIKDYLRLLRSSPSEVDALFDDLLINVTGFFRDADSFIVLKQLVYPSLDDARNAKAGFRVWVPGCSSGEEAYSLAISLLDYLGQQGSQPKIQIFATDIDRKVIDIARSGLYPERIAKEMSPEKLRRYFIKTSKGYQVVKPIRDMCVFAVQNVIKDPPFSRLNLICCRNLLIYLDSGAQKRLCHLFHYALLPEGFLMLGTSESVGEAIDLFKPLNTKYRLYAKNPLSSRFLYDFSVENSTDMELPKTPVDMTGPAKNLREQLCANLLAEYAAAAIVIDEKMDILHFDGTMGRYINPSPGGASLNLVKLISADLATELCSLVRAALKTAGRQQRNRIHYQRQGLRGIVNLKVIPLGSVKESFCRILVLFEDVSETEEQGADSASPFDSQRTTERDQIIDLERELISTREYMKTAMEDQETINEELKSANEEIQSTNEELQSANEELETAKEELQSTNEELATVNDELEHRNHELLLANSDLTNLLSNVNLPILMLGQDLTIRQFTPQAKQLFNLIDGDVGRPISNIKPNIEIPNLEFLVLDVVNNLATKEIRLKDNREIGYVLRIHPYKTLDNRIEGALLAFFENDSKDAQRLAAVVKDANEAILVQDFDGKIIAWNPAASRAYGYSEAEALTMNIAKLIPANGLKSQQGLINSLREGAIVEPYRTSRLHKEGALVAILLSATVLVNKQGTPYAIASTERLLT
jgi:two-component system CheB/CheR fusion protein